jgi:hypothetical protein
MPGEASLAVPQVAVLASSLCRICEPFPCVPPVFSDMPAGLSRLISLRWLCLRWLDRLPVAHLAPLTNLVALQLKNIDKPPGKFELHFDLCAWCFCSLQL